MSEVARQGANGFCYSRKARPACCGVRKVEPLGRALAGAVMWITGVRAAQSAELVSTRLAVVEPRYGLIKVNPLFGAHDEN